ncbi:unnamed protein product [Arctia plantaginis]|uniref:Uncharacterized protein n=1 Tax=Arctia plantaginis TaxID=874455 RepID=A0A8S1AG96_ARCPL|nr:unnamed protein product [Arctia plantaginis]
MLCPEVWNFPPPKVIQSKKDNQNLESVKNTLNLNWFYKSVIVTCPDEIHTPSFIKEIVTENSDYYKLSSFSLTEFVEPAFIESFVKAGKLFCLSASRNCIIQNCAAVTPDGVLILHVLEHVYQTLGFEGKKRPFGYYEVKIDLKSIKRLEKVKIGLSKLELFDIYLIWEPQNEKPCSSSVVKYFHERGIKISVNSLDVKNISPKITEAPSVKDLDPQEITEWIGMLAHQTDLSPTEGYISSYSQPESENSLKTTRISLYIVKGFIPMSLVTKISEKLNAYVMSRETDHYWSAISVQSDENSPWQWNTSSPKMFQAQDSSCNVFFTHQNHVVHCIGQLKYS